MRNDPTEGAKQKDVSPSPRSGFSALRLTLILILGTALIGVGFTLLTTPQPTAIIDPPWQVVQEGNGIRVLGLHIGSGTLADAQQLIGEDGKFTLFEAEDGRYSMELFFERVPVGGLTGAMVVTALLEQARMATMAERGLRVSKAASGSRKISPHSDDIHTAVAAQIETLTFLPSSRLDEATVLQRFGSPDERFQAEDSGVVYLLYPERGLFIALAENTKPVMTYMRPGDFARNVAPLRSSVGVS